MFVSEIKQTEVSLSDKGKSISELVKAQQELFTESQQIFAEITALATKYQSDLRELTKKQSAIAQKAAAIDETLFKLVK